MTPRRAHLLIDQLGSAQSLWNTPVKHWPISIRPQTEKLIATCQQNFNPDQWLSEMTKAGIKHLTYGTADYPKSLMNLYDPPLVLYTAGKLCFPFKYPSLAVVGSRKRTSAGEKAVAELLPPLIHQGLIIVSGLAYGIDSDAHKCTLDHKGKTVAVLGSGLAMPYPSGNTSLFNTIKNDGLVVSEYPPFFKARRWTFPARNRIIAALSDAVLVIEASERSGALITADCATQLGKDVMAVPGTIHNTNSRGTNLLIQNGAKMILNSQDIADELPNFQIVAQETIKIELTDPIQAEIYEILAESPKDIDYIVKSSASSAADIQSALTIMTIRGLITEYQGRQFARIEFR